jgi:ketosteroid isomerase-like protein
MRAIKFSTTSFYLSRTAPASAGTKEFLPALLKARYRKKVEMPIQNRKPNVMKIVLIILSMFCASSVLVSAQQADDAGTITKVLALENAWNQAEEKKDTKALGALFDNSLVYITYQGTLQTKAEFLAQMRTSLSQPQQELTGSVTAHVLGSVVIVTGLYVAKGTENGKPYVRRGRFVDTWAPKDGGWRCVASQSTPLLH